MAKHEMYFAKHMNSTPDHRDATDFICGAYMHLHPHICAMSYK